MRVKRLGGEGPVRTGPSQKLRNHTAIPEVKGQGLVEQSEPGPSSLQYRNETMELVPVWTLVTACHGLRPYGRTALTLTLLFVTKCLWAPNSWMSVSLSMEAEVKKNLKKKHKVLMPMLHILQMGSHSLDSF